MLLGNKKGFDALLFEYGGSAKAFPDIAGTYRGKNIIVCGDGLEVWKDLEAFGCRADTGRGRVEKPGWDFMTVNKLGETFPGNIEHWYSNSIKALSRFMHARRDEYEKEFKAPAHSHCCEAGAKYSWPWPAQGTSGLGAVLTASGLGYDRIVICGMPLDNGPHNGEPHWRGTRFASSEVPSAKDGGPERHWKLAIDTVLKGRARSMSGRTKEWLGDAIEWR